MQSSTINYRRNYRSAALESVRRSIPAMVDLFDYHGVSIRNHRSFRCPFHEDKNPSVSIYTGSDGVVRFKCHSGSCGFSGDIVDVESAFTGIPVADILRELSR